MSATPRQISAFLTATRELEEVTELTRALHCSQPGPGDSPLIAAAPKPTGPGRVALNAYADPLVYNAWPGPLKLHKDACCINFANQPRRPINFPVLQPRPDATIRIVGCITKQCWIDFTRAYALASGSTRLGTRCDEPLTI